MNLAKNIRGFTLIELLVVITIIGILATGATAVYTSQIQKARDTTRINDVKALQSGVEQSYQDISEYPRGSTLQTELMKYLAKLPTDPKFSQNCNNGGTPANAPACAYAYRAAADSNGIAYGAYELSTAFENLGNVQTKAATDAGSAAGGGLVRLELGVSTDTIDTGIDDGTVTPGTVGVINAAGTALATPTEDQLIVIINRN